MWEMKKRNRKRAPPCKQDSVIALCSYSQYRRYFKDHTNWFEQHRDTGHRAGDVAYDLDGQCQNAKLSILRYREIQSAHEIHEGRPR